MDPRQAVIDLRDLTSSICAEDLTPEQRLDLITAVVIQWESLDRWMSVGGFNPWEDIEKGFEHD